MTDDQIIACVFAKEGGIAMLWDDDDKVRITTFQVTDRIKGVYEKLKRSETGNMYEADLISETNLDGTQRLMLMMLKKPGQ